VGGAGGVETLKDVFAQLYGTRVLFGGQGGRGFGVHWAGTAPLLCCSLE
jgi:hypothetical protein